MDASNRPSKELIREWLMRRQVNREPLPEMEQIQRALGWARTKKTKAARH
jgi:hypothetical protein